MHPFDKKINGMEVELILIEGLMKALQRMLPVDYCTGLHGAHPSTKAERPAPRLL